MHQAEQELDLANIVAKEVRQSMYFLLMSPQNANDKVFNKNSGLYSRHAKSHALSVSVTHLCSNSHLHA